MVLVFAVLSLASPALALDGSKPIPAPAQVSPLQQANGGVRTANLSDMISLFQVKADKYYDDMGFSSDHYAYTESELTMLATVIHMEVRGESYTAMLAVGDVVMNRVLSPGYPGNTIAEVVTRPNQFCYNPAIKPAAECIRAAKDVLDREVWVIPQDVYFFKVSSSSANWGRHVFFTHIGVTAFYEDNYSGRSGGNSLPAALYNRIYEWPRYGCEPGLRVIRVQTMLNSLGYKVQADGFFDTGTRDALSRFQAREGLAPSGIADPATLERMISKCRGDNELAILLGIS